MTYAEHTISYAIGIQQMQLFLAFSYCCWLETLSLKMIFSSKPSSNNKLFKCKSKLITY